MKSTCQHSGIELRIDYEVGAGEAARALRQAFDRDKNGLLDPGEQAALVEHLARSAVLRARLSVDGADAALGRKSARAENADLPPFATALLAVRVELSASWPAGTGDWRGRRRVALEAEDPSGHIPVVVSCDKCRISESSSGVWEKKREQEHVLGANTPLDLLIAF